MRLPALISALALSIGLSFADKPVTITILHTNDIHAHIEPVMISKKPYGGYARQATLIKRFRHEDPNVILLNAGDVFQGTMYFNVYGGLADAAYMNVMHFDAMAVGNHEFDRGPEGLASFARLITFPLLSANIDVSAEPALKDLVKPYAIVGSGDARLGVVGATTEELPSISSPGPNVKLSDLLASIQKSVDAIRGQGVHKVVLLSHLGYSDDQQIAKKLHGVSVIVGGHSHTPLGTPALPGWPTNPGPYPTKETDADGKQVLVVQAWEWGKVLGRLKLKFNAEGRVESVLAATPVVVDETVPEDLEVKSMVAAFQKPIEAAMNEPVGFAATPIDKENAMANVIADAMLDATTKLGPVAAFVNSGGVRSGLEAGQITFGAATSVQPFRNTLVVLDVTGAELLKALEHGTTGGGLLKPSKGTSYTMSRDNPEGSRVSNVIVAGEALDLAKTYRITLLNFTANGGDGHTILRDATGKRTDTGIVDIDSLLDYLKAHNPLTPPTERRIH